jgi:hypothetical protein
MSDGEYFSSEQAEKAKMFDMIQKGKALKAHRVALNGELRERVASWKRLAELYENNLGENVFRVREDELEVLRPYPPGRSAPPNRPPLNTVANLPRMHFDGETLWVLITDLEKTRREIAKITEELRSADLTI